MNPLLFIEPFFLFVFLPVTLLLFRIFAGAGRTLPALTVLFGSSLFFYSKFGLEFLALLVASILVNFAAGYIMAAPGEYSQSARKRALIVGVFWNLGTLAWFKYLGYFAFLFDKDGWVAATLSDFVIPAGISFYTFHQITFLADAYARKKEVIEFIQFDRSAPLHHSFIRYAAFVCFFPQLVIGPIVYMSEFAKSTMRKQFGRVRRLDIEIGLTLMIIGLFKKLCIADNLAPISQAAFETTATGAAVDPMIAWAGAIAYFFQLYFDFSGYTDMALGIARMFGIAIPINFDSPLRAAGIRDFYARWHMTLTRVIVRFLFTPLALAGTRKTIMPKTPKWKKSALVIWIPLMINFQVIALWHGALATFALFGLIHGLWAILETEISAKRWWKNFAAKWGKDTILRAGQIATILPLMLTFALFGSQNLAGFGTLLESMFLFPADPVTGIVAKRSLIYVVIAAGVVWLLPNSTELMRRYRPAILTRDNPSTTPALLRFAWRPNLYWSAAVSLLALACLYNMTNQSPFLYQGF